MTNPPFALLLFSILLLACTPQADNTAQHHRLLSAAAPAEGSCVGWQRQLSQGEQLYDVEYCLREKALNDYPAAQADAKILATWQFDDASGTQLRPLINTLLQFSSRAGLAQYLKQQYLFTAQNEESDLSDQALLDQALTVLDYMMLMGTVAGFDGETGFYPNEHHVLLSSLASLSDLSAATFTEQAPASENPDHKPYILNASLNGKDYRVEAADYGDWYDVSAVITLLNTLAADHASAYRYIVLPASDQFVLVWVAPQKALAELVHKGLIRIPAGIVADEEQQSP